jgi:hypothetical protein
VRKLKINPDLLIVLPVKAEDVGDWRGVVRSKIRVHDEAVGNVPSDEESYHGCARHGNKSRSDGAFQEYQGWTK